MGHIKTWLGTDYEARTLHLGCRTYVGHGARLGNFCMCVPTMSFKKLKLRDMGTRGIKFPFIFHKTKRAFMLKQ